MYDLQLDEAVKTVKKANAKLVLIQLPDGIKPEAAKIVAYLRGHTQAKILVWAGSNYGACDIPVGMQHLGIDLVIHFGHTQWVFDHELTNIKSKTEEARE